MVSQKIRKKIRKKKNKKNKTKNNTLKLRKKRRRKNKKARGGGLVSSGLKTTTPAETKTSNTQLKMSDWFWISDFFENDELQKKIIVCNQCGDIYEVDKDCKPHQCPLNEHNISSSSCNDTQTDFKSALFDPKDLTEWITEEYNDANRQIEISGVFNNLKIDEGIRETLQIQNVGGDGNCYYRACMNAFIRKCLLFWNTKIHSDQNTDGQHLGFTPVF